MRKLYFKGPYNLIAFEVIPALVQAGIIAPVTDETILTYRPPHGPDRWIYEWLVDAFEEGTENSEDVSKESLDNSQGVEGLEILE